MSTQKEVSMEMATSRPISELEQNNFNRFGELIRTLSGLSFAVLGIWASLEFFSLFNMTYSRLSMFSQSVWVARFSAFISALVLWQTHKLLLSSSKQWLYDFWTLRIRADKAAEMKLKAVGFPTVSVIIILLALYLSIIGSFQLVESYGYKATTRSYDPTTLNDMISQLENNKHNALFSSEKSLKAEQTNEISSLKSEINKLEVERMKWAKMKVSTAAATKAKEELSWINSQIRQKENQIATIKDKYRSKIEERKAEIVQSYTSKSDSLLYKQEQGIKAIEEANKADVSKEISTQKEGNYTGVIASLFFLLTFVSCQVYRIQYSVASGIYEKQTYSFIDSLGGMSGIFFKVHLALIKERVSKKLIDFYNRNTVGEISELDNTFSLVQVKPESSQTQTNIVADNLINPVVSVSYEEVDARFKLLKAKTNDYVNKWENGERRTENQVKRLKEFFHQLYDLYDLSSNEDQEKTIKNYADNILLKIEFFEKALLKLKKNKEKEVTND